MNRHPLMLTCAVAALSTVTVAFDVPPPASDGTLCLVMSLDGEMPQGQAEAVSFDLNGDGLYESIVPPAFGAGLLAMDLDGNGAVDSGLELFGASTGTPFEDLAAHDSDGNGWLESDDDAYASISVWTPGSDEGSAMELRTLAAIGITSIYLGWDDTEDGGQATGYLGFDGEIGFIATVDATTFENVPSIAECKHGKPQGDCAIDELGLRTNFKCRVENADCTNNQGTAGKCETKPQGVNQNYCFCTGGKISPMMDLNWATLLGLAFAVITACAAWRVQARA